MVKEKPIYEFFKRKRDDPIVDREEPPVLAPLIGLEQIQDEECDQNIINHMYVYTPCIS